MRSSGRLIVSSMWTKLCEDSASEQKSTKDNQVMFHGFRGISSEKEDSGKHIPLAKLGVAVEERPVDVVVRHLT